MSWTDDKAARHFEIAAEVEQEFSDRYKAERDRYWLVLKALAEMPNVPAYIRDMCTAALLEPVQEEQAQMKETMPSRSDTPQTVTLTVCADCGLLDGDCTNLEHIEATEREFIPLGEGMQDWSKRLIAHTKTVAAERDRYKDALEDIAGYIGGPVTEQFVSIARKALNTSEDTE